MKREAMILGTGKMARNIGAHFVKKGFSITFVSNKREQLNKTEKYVGKITRRLARFSEMEIPTDHCFRTQSELKPPVPPIVIETTTEDLGIKREAVKKIESLMEDSLTFTNSSSVLPSEIGDRVLGLHFFYPVELTGLVEIVIPRPVDPKAKEKALSLVESLELKYLLQDEKRAFAVNRLLLPLQNEVMACLMAGVPASQVDECSQSSLLPMGQLSLMNSVGLSTVLESVKNYSKRVSDSLDYSALKEGLTMLIGGRPLPENTIQSSKLRNLRHKFQSVFMKTCLRFLEKQELTGGELELVLKDVFQAQTTFKEAKEGKA